MGYSKAEVSEIVRRVLLKALQESETAPQETKPEPRPASVLTSSARRIIGEADIAAVSAGSELEIQPGTVITPLARQMAMERGVRLVERVAPSVGSAPAPTRVAAVSPAGEKRVALGADHGGFALKEYLKSDLTKDGYAVIDCGANSAESVDYPDYAYAVAKLVSDGQAWRGIIVDGAGIGSCMAANKVPRVRAAMCYDVSSAGNAREHNDANVLTLGGGLIGNNLARQIVETFLSTDFGGGRHARRVEKIMDIERRFLKST
jgi:ribose 5-phosphate isomerase B